MFHVRLKRAADELAAAQHHTAKRTALPIDMFGRGIDHDVGAEFERRLKQRSGKYIIDHQSRIHGVRHFCDRLNIDNLQTRIGRGLQKSATRLRTEGGTPLIQVSTVNQSDVKSVAREQVTDNIEARPKESARCNYVISSLQLRHQRSVDGGHTGARRHACFGALN